MTINKNTIQASKGSVVITGKVKGNITTYPDNNGDADLGHPKNSSNSKIALYAATITAIGAIVSGILISASNWFSG